ncbi:MAG: methyltransferase [Chloroflexota bacterium]
MSALGPTARLFADDTEPTLVRLALELGADRTGGPLSPAEDALLAQALTAPLPSKSIVERIRAAIRGGGDPLGEILCRVRTAGQRRTVGAFYSPPRLVETMVDWVLARDPRRVVDAGCGSGRFAAEVARRAPTTPVFAIDADPVATILTRAVLAMLAAHDATVLQADYTLWQIPPERGRTAFIGNPPYVRHHDLSREAKRWAVDAGTRLGQKVSGLAGLHLHFYLATMLKARPGDVGCFVTSAEWLDVGYGSALRALFLDGLGGQALHVVDPTAVTFSDVQTTAVIACFERDALPSSIRVSTIASPDALTNLNGGRAVPRSLLAGALRWSALVRSEVPAVDLGAAVPLGALARVHRGLVTGANNYFLLDRRRAADLGLLPWCRPAITDGQEILRADGVIRDSAERKLLLDVPRGIDRQCFPALDAYLRTGEQRLGDVPAVAERYIASRRKPWWYLGRQAPAPIVASYMARQAPAFALNPDGLALINIGHGLHPVGLMNRAHLARLCSQLNANRATFRGQGRTYQGGLEKFEPREMEALRIDPAFMTDE